MPAARSGVPLQILKREVPFSYWPVRPPRRGRHHALQSTLFATDPWLIIKRSVKQRCPTAHRAEALAYVEQAQDFHTAAFTAKMFAARPLAQYYSIMNLAKAYSLTVGSAGTFDKAQHGLSEQLPPGGQELRDATLDAYGSPNKDGVPQVYAELMRAYSQVHLATGTKLTYKVPELLPQILVGHRLWAQASGVQERFVAIEKITFMHDPASKQLWLRLYFKRSDMTRLGLGIARLLKESGLQAHFGEVDSNLPEHICYEQATPNTYTSYPADKLMDVIKAVQPYIWATVSSTKPYRRYYVLVAPGGNRTTVVPQLMSLFAITYYLGSITRYRPHHFDRIQEGSFGTMLQEFIMNQPSQFVYLLASEFAQQDVSRAAIA
jgi:hypothetical protein